ncbi:MAG: hypothetical protein V4447_10205 [Pseudomonadota bacterium]
MPNKDNGDWLSAQQAVLPDGTEISNLPLINKKLPPLVTTPTPQESDVEKDDINGKARPHV